MDFDEWLKTVCFQRPTPEAWDLAKCAWDEQSKRIALLEKVAVHAQFYLKGLPDTDGYELDEALRAAGYLKED